MSIKTSQAMAKSKLVYGIGRNDAGYPVSIYAARIGGKQALLWRCPFYQAWMDMLARCYSAKSLAKYPTYMGCSATPEWLSFSAFRQWMLTQDHEGKQLDKDILFPGNKVYSQDACVFISIQLNSFMLDNGAARGEWPIGVCWSKAAGKFQSQCRNPFTGKNEYLGLFADPDAAHESWRTRKHLHACTYADQQTDPRVAVALRGRYAAIQEAK